MARYELSFSDPSSHHVDVCLRLSDRDGRDNCDGPLVLWMPTWAPGSYLVREFARHVRDVTATDGEGRSLGVRRLDKCRFAVEAGTGAVVVSYRVYAFEMSVRTSFVEEGNALLNGHSVFLAAEGYEHDPVELVVHAPEGWDVRTGMTAVTGVAFTYQAVDFEDLCDHPLQCGRHEVLEFTAAGKPHELVMIGAENHDRERVVEDTRRLVETADRLFGPLPYERYVFIVQHTASGRGGLEHENSSVLQFPRFGYTDPRAYHDFVTLVAHEHFHVWNVKRTKPRDFVPYDLVNETYTTLLWVSEGFTAYYDELLPVRAGVIPTAEYLERLGEEITRYRETPGRLVQSLADASKTAWIGLYRSDEATPNAGISYYQKGALVGLLLDLEIRTRSGGKRSLDDVMRTLFTRFPADSDGFSEEDVVSAANEAAGVDLASFFERAVHRTDELDFETALATVGLRLEAAPIPDGKRPRIRDVLGVRIRGGDRRQRNDTVETDSPAARAKLSAKDEIVALDGWRAEIGTLAARLAEKAPGSDVVLTVFRDGRLMTFDVTLPERPGGPLRVVADEDANEAARAAQEAWLDVGPRGDE